MTPLKCKGFKSSCRILKFMPSIVSVQCQVLGLNSAHHTANFMGFRRWEEANDEGFMAIGCCHCAMEVGVIGAVTVVPPDVLGNGRPFCTNYT